MLNWFISLADIPGFLSIFIFGIYSMYMCVYAKVQFLLLYPILFSYSVHVPGERRKNVLFAIYLTKITEWQWNAYLLYNLGTDLIQQETGCDRKPPMDLLADTQNCALCMDRDRFPHHRLQRKPVVRDPGMPVSLTRCGGGNAVFPAHAQPIILRICQEVHLKWNFIEVCS